MIRFPNAKINLGLSVVRKREDGYHDLETVFYPVPICDVLEVHPNDKGEIAIISSGIEVTDNIEDNLIVKAYRKMQQYHDLPGVDVYFKKQIPFGAGLGGGSADASFMLLMLRDLFLPEVTDEQLEGYAALIGADCAFFIKNKPVYAEGIGEVFSPISVSLKGYKLVIVKPDVHVSTRDAFGNIVAAKPEFGVKEVIENMPIEEWADRLKNDFETTVFAKHPLLGDIKQKLYDMGAVYASMTGSGASLYGLFRSEDEIDKNSFPGCFFWQGECKY